MSMRVRLYAFLVILTIVTILGAVAAFIMSGQFTSNKKEAEQFAEKEFSNIYRRLAEETGDTAIQLVSLSQALSRSLENSLQSRQIPEGGLSAHPAELEEIIENELIRLQLALERSKCSGVFLILDATVNPGLPNASNSKAGLHIRNAEPRVPGTFEMSWYYLRGFPGIAYRNGLLVQKKWDMEFHVDDSSFFHMLVEEGRTSDLPLPKLYYWSKESVISEPGQATLICSIPIIDSGGDVFGICGFEISEWNFSTSFTPDNSKYREAICLFGMMEGSVLKTERAMVSGWPSATSALRDGEPLSVSAAKGLWQYQSEHGKAFYGLHNEVRLLSTDSPFLGQRFYVALLLPKDTIDSSVFRTNIQLFSICVALFIACAVVSVYGGRRYLNPIISAFESIKAGNLDGAKTHIIEIDTLIDTIKNLRSKGDSLPDNLFDNFFARIRALTQIETKILRYYIEDLNNKEILSKIFINKNTVKMHNKQIYKKLGVNSKRELMLYVELIKMCGLEERIV